MKNTLISALQSAVNELFAKGVLPSSEVNIQIDHTKDKAHGDFASNLALMLAKPAQRKPREIAELLLEHLGTHEAIRKVEIAGPGFLNFFLAPTAMHAIVQNILQHGETFGRENIGKGRKVIVEFVSSNPTGPLHVGHGRHGAYGAVVSDLLSFFGFAVHKEYYVNDAGRQMDILAVSVWLRYLELTGESFAFPVNAYKGDYVVDMAKKIIDPAQTYHAKALDVFAGLPKDEPEGGDKELYIDAVIERARKMLGSDKYKAIFNHSLGLILADIKADLADFGVTFDQWFSERDFTQSTIVDEHIQQLQAKNVVYELDGALWFRATAFGDEKDRVLQRANGQKTYFANDLIYHIHKFERGFDQVIDIFGSDHHGYIPRIKAGLKAFGLPVANLKCLLMQFVSLYRSGNLVQMSTRSGSFVTLRELREEVGNDAARYFYLMRKCEQPVDFDLDLAKSKSNENPVYYIQYAHARIVSVFRQLAEKGYTYHEELGLAHLELLLAPQELSLIQCLNKYAMCLQTAALQYEPHQLTNYLRELATEFHSYYNSQQFIVEDDTLRHARLALISAARQVFVNGLQLIGVSSPEVM
jgi:arginyl-tRNA synthetase